MKPMMCLRVLDRRYAILEKRLESMTPDAKHFRSTQIELGALSHARRLVAFEVQYINTLRDQGEYEGNRKAPEFLREVVEGAPKEGAA